MTDALRNEALEKLSQGIEESRQLAQQQTMKLAQDYFDDSVEELRQQVRERRARLETLPDQVPGGREEGFQARFEQLMERYSKLEECLSEARSDGDFSEVEPAATESTNAEAAKAEAASSEATKSGSATGTAESAKEEEVEATDAARREAKELGVDLTQVKGTGSGGRIVIWDVTEFVNKKEAIDEEGGQEQAGQAGQAGQAAQKAAGQATEQAGQTADGAGRGMQDAAGGALGQVGQVTEQAQEAAEDVSGDPS